MRRTAKSNAEQQLGAWIDVWVKSYDEGDKGLYGRADQVIYVLCEVLNLDSTKVRNDWHKYIERYRPDLYNEFYDLSWNKAPLLLDMARKRGVNAQEAFDKFTKTGDYKSWYELKHAAGIRYISEVG